MFQPCYTGHRFVIIRDTDVAVNKSLSDAGLLKTNSPCSPILVYNVKNPSTAVAYCFARSSYLGPLAIGCHRRVATDPLEVISSLGIPPFVCSCEPDQDKASVRKLLQQFLGRFRSVSPIMVLKMCRTVRGQVNLCTALPAVRQVFSNHFLSQKICMDAGDMVPDLPDMRLVHTTWDGSMSLNGVWTSGKWTSGKWTDRHGRVKPNMQVILFAFEFVL